jgi:hypothetical protein
MKKQTNAPQESSLQEPVAVYSKKTKTPETIAPEGYMTGDEFRSRAMIKVNEFCDKHGIV